MRDREDDNISLGRETSGKYMIDIEIIGNKAMKRKGWIFVEDRYI